MSGQPGQSLSLQSHFHRSEHWIVVEGTAKVTVGDEVTLLTENQSLYVPAGAKHRVENPGKIPVVFIEVQTGTYLGEDDIVRYERSEEHTSELQSLMSISYAVFCLKKKKQERS